jgi:hypothetical protein
MIQDAVKRTLHEIQGPLSTHAFVRSLGVPDLPGRTSPFDPGYDVQTVISHLEQSHHLISRLKLSMACWLIADESATRAKIAAAKRLGVPMVTGGSIEEVAQRLHAPRRALRLVGPDGAG